VEQNNQQYEKLVNQLSNKVKTAYRLFLVSVLIGIVLIFFPNSIVKLIEPQATAIAQIEKPITNKIANADLGKDEIKDGIHLQSGLIVDEGYELVMGTCGACHSLKLVTQNRADRKGWLEMIRWMQETQKLWDLGPNEDKILTYLAKNYAPQNKGRRENLTNIEWYELEN